MMNSKVYSPPFSMADVLFKQQKRSIREKLGGSSGLAKDSNKEVALSITKLSSTYLQNPEEIYDKRNNVELDARLNYKNNIATPWYDNGSNEEKGPPAPFNDKNVVVVAKTNSLAYENQFNPDPNAKGVLQQSQADARSTLQILNDIKNKSSRVSRIKRRARS